MGAAPLGLHLPTKLKGLIPVLLPAGLILVKSPGPNPLWVVYTCAKGMETWQLARAACCRDASEDTRRRGRAGAN